eukprot:m.51246 g.51246  ORF g.51246 m.51246 type:complete len:135 (-) comp6291_c0_seq2:106-510(-)
MEVLMDARRRIALHCVLACFKEKVQQLDPSGKHIDAIRQRLIAEHVVPTEETEDILLLIGEEGAINTAVPHPLIDRASRNMKCSRADAGIILQPLMDEDASLKVLIEHILNSIPQSAFPGTTPTPLRRKWIFSQ